MYDACIIGGGHNGLVAATLLAKAGRSVLVLERRDHVGGAAVSERPWAGVDARISRYSYLVSLMPRALREQLGLRTEMRRRSVSSYSPRQDGTGLLIRSGEPPGANWAAFEELTGKVARAVFPTLTEPLLSRAQLRARVGDLAAWEALFERPLGHVLRKYFEDDFERGIIATDALIGTFAGLEDESLRQNRCFLYHVIGNETGDWDVPVGGMGALTEELAALAWAAGAEVRLGCEVTSIETDGVGAEVFFDGGSVPARRVLANVAPAVLARLLGEPRARRSRPRGRAAQAQHALEAAPEAARSVRGPARGVRGDVSCQRVRHAARRGLRERAAGRRARPRAVRDLLPLADRPDDPGRGAAGVGGADAHLLRPAHAHAALPRRRSRAGQGARPSRPRCGR